MANKVTRCGECSKAYNDYGVGFASVTVLRCADRDLQAVSADDGCTFGVRGSHGSLKADCDVLINEQVAAYGC